MALLKIHDTQEANGNIIKGIGKHNIQCSNIEISNDALADGDSNSINKPGTSIPSLFARMLFFRTAFKGVTQIDIPNNMSVPAYNKMVSLCLDVFELVYSHNPRLRFERWNIADQIRNVRNQASNEILSAALDKQVKQHINVPNTGRQVNDIFLIYLDNALIGGTSPYTFVYASSDWKGLGIVRSLHQRKDRKFREFIYKLNIVLKSSGINQMKAFSNYVDRCLQHTEDPDLRREMIVLDKSGTYTQAIFSAEYPDYYYDDERGRTIVEVSSTPRLGLPARAVKGFDSEMFINSSIIDKGDAIQTPLFLHNGSEHSNLKYYDDVKWSSNTDVPNVASDNHDTMKREMPDCTAYQHSWLSEADFLESDLMVLPYNINKEKYLCISYPTGEISYLLPLRPMFFKYFKASDVNRLLQVNFNDKSCNITLSVPVTNLDKSSRNNIIVRKSYNLQHNVKAWNKDGLSVNLGIFPFYRIPANSDIAGLANMQNSYTVMQNINEGYDDEKQRIFSDSELNFYSVGNITPIDLSDSPVTTGDSVKSRFYHVDQVFDYIRMTWKAESSSDICSGTLVPRFGDVKNGKIKRYYSIDFGTTNTHIAYADSSEVEAHSFSSADILANVEYLNTINAKSLNLSCGRENAAFLNKEARQFFPQFNDDSYNFPIRTVTIENNNLAPSSKLFSGAAIGMNFSKEFMVSSVYHTNIKWEMENTNPSIEISKRIQLFFEEVMWMVRNHWLVADTEKTNLPVIIITYPQAMTQRHALIQKWRDAYNAVFGSGANENIKEMVESLAPCYKLISDDGLTIDGVMNVDIGGGTTDIQYYRMCAEGAANIVTSKYTSVLFAGDDLWGVGFENVKKIKTNSNNFTTSAQQALKETVINVVSKNNNAANKRIGDISQNFPAKEFINLLLRDVHKNFTNWLSMNQNNVCRKTMFLHYAAIIYYIGMWIRDDRHIKQIPATINFTGMGSKYVRNLFATDELATTDENLTEFTKRILKSVVSNKDCPTDFKVQFEKNPKFATAEGAALFATTNTQPARNIVAYHAGYNGEGCMRKLAIQDLGTATELVMESFKEFLETYNGLPADINAIIIPKFDKQELQTLIGKAEQSMQQMHTEINAKFQNSNQVTVSDSLFFWPLKGSLYNL